MSNTMSEMGFGRYQIQYRLGQSSVATVYLAHDTIEYQAVALKIFNPVCQAVLQDATAQNLLKQHILLISQVQHPAIVPILRAGSIEQHYFLAMPYFTGGNLADKLRSGPVAGPQIVPWVQRLGAAIDFAHRRGIHHGALTPCNILFDAQDLPFVADFGLRRLFYQLVPSLIVAEDKTYSSPEQLLRDMRFVDHRADLYAFGLLLYEMVTGSPPYLERADSPIVWSHFFQPVPRLRQSRPDLASNWQSVIDTALAKQPDERFATAGDLATAVASAASPTSHPLNRLVHTAQLRINSEITRWRGQRRQVHTPATAPPSLRKRRWPWLLFSILIAVALSGILVVTRWPIIGARIADPLRSLFGDAGVTLIETALFEVQDRLIQVGTSLGLAQPDPPWQIAEMPVDPVTPLPAATPPPLALLNPPHLAAGEATTSPATSLPPSPTATPSLSEWEALAAIQPFGSLFGEGIWQPYWIDLSGQVLAQRTFLQPDADRPHSMVAVVAMDLTRTRLNFVLGTQDPTMPDGPRGEGVIPPRDLLPGKLLATFNGGFKATHGGYGAMAAGIVAIPARIGFATVVIENSGGVRIGDWGRDIFPSTSFIAYRQNANLVVQAGQINPKVYSDTLKDWGGTINGETITWRSGLGLSPDGEILYYFAGPALSMPALALAMQASGVSNALLLDINEYWVHFATIENHNNKLVAIPLFAEGMDIHVDRYLRQAERDFFYVTAR